MQVEVVIIFQMWIYSGENTLLLHIWQEFKWLYPRKSYQLQKWWWQFQKSLYLHINQSQHVVLSMRHRGSISLCEYVDAPNGDFAHCDHVLMKPYYLISPPPHTHTRQHTCKHTIAHSVSPGGCFRCSHRRCSADNRLWQMSRHHLKAVTCSRIETNQRCLRASWSRLGCIVTLLSLFLALQSSAACFWYTVLCSVRTDPRVV